MNGCDVTMRWEICPQILLWTANFDKILARSAHPQISNQISRNPCLGQRCTRCRRTYETPALLFNTNELTRRLLNYTNRGLMPIRTVTHDVCFKHICLTLFRAAPLAVECQHPKCWLYKETGAACATAPVSDVIYHLMFTPSGLFCSLSLAGRSYSFWPPTVVAALSGIGVG